MNKKFKNIIKIVVFIFVGVFLFWLVYKDFQFGELWETLKTLKYWVFIFGLLIAIVSHICRAVRWQMLIDTDEKKTRFSNTFLAVLNGYLANLAIPRSGEVTRCAQVAKYDNISFSKVVGTMVSERIIDITIMLLLTIFTIIIQTTQIEALINNNPVLAQNLAKLWKPTTIIILIAIALLFILLFYFIAKGKFNRWKIFEKISNFMKGFLDGLVSLKNIKKPFWFIFHSFAIWVCYFLEFYICFFAFDGAISELNFVVAITVFMACSYGMLAPSPNGLGAYHFMVIQTLIVYGIAESDAGIFAMVVHGIQTIYIIVLGLISVVLTPLINKNK